MGLGLGFAVQGVGLKMLAQWSFVSFGVRVQVPCLVLGFRARVEQLTVYGLAKFRKGLKKLPEVLQYKPKSWKPNSLNP